MKKFYATSLIAAFAVAALQFMPTQPANAWHHHWHHHHYHHHHW